MFTYEANPALEAPIRALFSLNQVSLHLEIGLLGDRSGTHQFYVNKNFWASSMIAHKPGLHQIELPMKSFNQEVKQINPTFLIMDIEGGEYELLKIYEFILGQERVEWIKAH